MDSTPAAEPLIFVYSPEKNKVRHEPETKNSLSNTFVRAIHRFSLKPGDKVLVAVSGGPDSVCLLYLLKALFPAHPLSIHVAHLNHGLRPEAEEEARFVERLCKDWRLPLTSEKRSVLPRPTKGKASIQAAARAVRYRFFKEVAHAVSASWIALGHTADDQAETFLMRILRGAGVEGLGGIPERREGGIIRPLLRGTRKEILGLLSQEKIPYIEDPSNRKPVYQRNRIRHALLPILEQYNPKIKEAFCREAMLLRDENDFVHQAMQALLPGIEIETDGPGLSFNIEKLQALHPALQRRALRWGIEKLLGNGEGIDFESIETLRLDVMPAFGERTHLFPRGLKAKKQGSRLHIGQEQRSRVRRPKRRPSQEALGGRALEKQERILYEIGASYSDNLFGTWIDLPEWGLQMKISSNFSPSVALSPCIASFDFDKLRFPLFLRNWQAGDRFAPLGMRGQRKKLQDFFVDAKIPQSKRRLQAVLACPQGILWVVGLRADERFRVTHSTLRILTLTVQAERKRIKKGY